MSDIFEREEQHNLFRLPEKPEEYKPDPPPNPIAQTQIDPALPAKPVGLTEEERRERYRLLAEGDRERADRQRSLSTRTGVEFSTTEFQILNKLRKDGIFTDDDIYKYAFSKQVGDYLGLPTPFVFNYYDEMWAYMSGDIENRYTLPKGRWQAVKDSIQVAKNNWPMDEMGNQLSALHSQIERARGPERDKLQKEADELWEKISAIRDENEELLKGIPKDALTFLLTTMIQSAPLQMKTMAGGIKMGTYFGAGAAVVGAKVGSVVPGVGNLAGAATGFVTGFGTGMKVGGTEAGARVMAGLMYVDMIAAGMEQKNARVLSLIGGGINGLIESSLGVVAGAGKSLTKSIGGRVLSQEAQKRIAAVASDNFAKNIVRGVTTSVAGRNVATRTVIEVMKNAAEEGLEEALQYFVEQGMLAIGDAMQDDPVERNLFMDPQYREELKQSVLGGIAGGIGFGIMGLPLTISGNVATTAQEINDVKNLALNLNEEEFRTEMKNRPIASQLSDSQINSIRESVMTMREAEEATRAEELRHRRLYGSVDQSGEIFREERGNLYGEITRHVESGGLEKGEYVVGNPNRSENNAYAVLEYEKRGDKTEITGFNIGEAYEGLQEEILRNFASEMGTEINFDGTVYSPVENTATARRFGFEAEKASGRTDAESARTSARNAAAFSFSKQQYTAVDTKADITAKESFARQIREAGTTVQGAQVDAVVDIYDQVGRKWFGMGFDSFMKRMALNPDQFVTRQNMTDTQIGEWYSSKYSAQELAARGIDLNNLTEEQRQTAMDSVKGFAAIGIDGITNSITAAKKADISTFIHEGIHAFTNLAKTMDTELYNEMMKAAGLDAETLAKATPEQQAAMLRDAWEKLAHQAERYFHDGHAANTAQKNVFEKLKEFLKGIIDVLDSRKELTPEIKALYDNLFKDTQSDSVTQQGDSVTGQGDSVTKQGDSITQSEEFDIYQDEYDRIIRDESLPIEQRSEAAVEKAKTLFSDELNNKFKNDLQKYKDGTINPGQLLYVNSASDSYSRLPNNEFRLPVSVIKKATTMHKVKMDTIERLPELINSPVMILNSLTDPKAFVLVLDDIDIDGNPIIVSHKTTLKKINTISSIYGKENFDNFITNCIKQDKVIAADKNKATKYVRPQELQLLKGTLLDDLSSKISHISDDLSSPKENILFQTAYHGSPYRFDRFDTSYMGIGEGNQVYGWGLYFASKKEVSEWYYEELSNTTQDLSELGNIEKERILSLAKESELLKYLKTWLKEDKGQNRDVRFDDIIEYIQETGERENIEGLFKTISSFTGSEEKALKLFKNNDLQYKPGQIYEVDIPGDEVMLDWDKPFSGQPEQVKEGLKKLYADKMSDNFSGVPEYDGEKLYKEIVFENRMKKAANPEQAASLLLAKYGIKGIRYLDGYSRGAGEGSHNYVIFNDNEINILQTFFQDDGEFEAFMNDYPGVVKQAATFDSAEDLAAYYEVFGDINEDVLQRANDAGYFDRIYKEAQEAKNTTDTSGTIPEYDFNKNISAKKIITALRAYGISAENALEAAHLARLDKNEEAVSYLEELGVSRIDAEAYAEHAKVFTRDEYKQMQKDAKAEQEAAPKETVKLGSEPNEAVKKFFSELHESSKEIYPDEDNHKYWEKKEAELAAEGRTAHDFVEWVNTSKGFDDLVLIAARTQQDGDIRGETEAETRRNEAMAAKARAAFTNPNWEVAFKSVLAGKKIPDSTKKILKGMIKNRPLQYMETWAVLSGDDTWLPSETDAQKIKRLDTSGMVDEEYLQRQNPEELQRIGERLGHDRIQKKIQDGSLRFDDPDMESFEKQHKEKQSETLKKIEQKKEELGEYQDWLKAAEENERRHQMIVRQLARNKTNEGITELKKGQKKLQEVQADYRRVIKDMELEVKKWKITQRNNYQEFLRLLREQTEQQEQMEAFNELREIKKRDMKMVLRRVDLKNVHVTQAANIKWIQSHFDSYMLAAKWVGPGAKSLQQLYNQFITDEEYRNTLRKRLGGGYYTAIERTIYKDRKTGDARAYSDLSLEQRRRLKGALLDNKSIFEELGIDIDEKRKRYSPQEYAAIEAYMKDFIPADLLIKMQNLVEDENGDRHMKMEDWTVEDMQRLAGVVSNLRKEGRDAEQARKDARKQLIEERMGKTLQTLRANMPKNTEPEDRSDTAEKRIEEEKKTLRGLFYSTHNARRMFRRLEGHKDGYFYNSMTRAEYDAFNQEWSNALARRDKVAEQFKKLGIKETDLIKYTFEYDDGSGRNKRATLDEMLTFYYAQYNERAFHAVVFGNMATPDERAILEKLAGKEDLAEHMALEASIAQRYWSNMEKLKVFFAQEGNEKYRKVMDIIGNDYDENYQRLKDFVAREYNEELGSEAYYMPLNRLGEVPKEENDIQKVLADNGLSKYIGKGFTKGRVDIPSFAQQPIRTGLFSTWDSMVQKQEHLMAYDSLHRQMKHVFEGADNTSDQIQAALRGGWGKESIDFIKKWTSELAAPAVQEDVKNLNKIHRFMRGHFPAAMLGWRVASILKQAIESPPPFFQHMNPGEYIAAGISCLSQETREMIHEKSTYMKVRYFDPAMAVMANMQKAYLAGNIEKAEAIFAKIANVGMKGQGWIDAVCVMPGWLAAYKQKLADLNKTASDTMTAQQIEREAVHHADQVVRDCQPSSVLMDQAQLMKGSKDPFFRMLQQFQTPIVSIFQQLFVDTPVNFKNGRILQGLWTWGLYALIAITIGAMRDDEDEKLDPKNRAIDALIMPLEMIPMAGTRISFAAEDLLKTGKIRNFNRSNFPVVDSAFKTVNAISDKNWKKGGDAALEAFGFLTGLPVAAKRDIQKAVEEENPLRVLGIK